jgi:hypothetical protein
LYFIQIASSSCRVVKKAKLQEENLSHLFMSDMYVLVLLSFRFQPENTAKFTSGAMFSYLAIIAFTRKTPLNFM